jgi:exopolysaccharide biosynthesis polyprenyl glycosylphosphotransferase
LTGCLLSFDESPPGYWEFPILGSIEDLKKIVEDEVIDEVIFTVPIDDMPKCEQYISWCEEVGVAVHMKLDFIKTVVARTYPTNWDGLPMLTISATPQDPLRLLIKRTIDVAIASIALLVLSPVLIISAMLVKLTSKGPLIFKQRRVGLNGRQFMLYKFRSMYSDAEERKKELEALNEASGPVFKIRHDPRITPVGRSMRKYSIDELPQLWNVLRGDMSLVGPRPPVPEEVTKYERWQRRRLSMKPGITCLWQVSGRSQIGFEEWMQLDLEYIDNWSLKLDAVILLRTMPAVILARGAH